MYAFLVKITAATLAPKLGCEQGSAPFEKLQYGIYVFYLNTLKTLLLIVISLILGILPYIAVFAFAYGSLRIYSFGVHLKSTWLCTLLGLAYYLGSTYLALNVCIPIAVKAFIILLCAVCFFIYAPAQTRKRPIPEHQRKALKPKSVAMFLVVTVCMFVLHNFPVYSSLVFMAAVCQTINLLPVTYKIFRES